MVRRASVARWWGVGGAVSLQNSADLLPGHTAEKRGKRGGGQAQGGSLSCQPCFSSDLPSVSEGEASRLWGLLPSLSAFPFFPERNRKAWVRPLRLGNTQLSSRFPERQGKGPALQQALATCSADLGLFISPPWAFVSLPINSVRAGAICLLGYSVCT